ncbi:MAG: hypothetical protein R3B92_02180 [Patescibacteria group bacterium]|uniref:Uncharacterized protein n=1 Tax=candidate division WWE3 bacterium TaxID=2053526 RepID=A0A955ED04_UNCKA|nr:hypothetical protein [candidate division WWE3 bacterium]
MLLTPHTIVGVAVATAISNPLIAAPLSFALHFAGDKLPHWDFFSNTKNGERRVGWRPLAVMADMSIGIFIALTFTYYALWGLGDSYLALNIFLCGLASVLPDALTGPYIYTDNPPKFCMWIKNIQSKAQTQAPLPWGIFTQLVVVAVSVFLIWRSIL